MGNVDIRLPVKARYLVLRQAWSGCRHIEAAVSGASSQQCFFKIKLGGLAPGAHIFHACLLKFGHTLSVAGLRHKSLNWALHPLAKPALGPVKNEVNHEQNDR